MNKFTEKEIIREVVDFLFEISEGEGSRHDDLVLGPGLCSALKEFGQVINCINPYKDFPGYGDSFLYYLVQMFSPTWPQFSGCKQCPLPGGGRKWVTEQGHWEGERGELRRDLAWHIATEMEEFYGI